MKHHAAYNRLKNILIRTVAPLLVVILLTSCVTPTVAKRGDNDEMEPTGQSESMLPDPSLTEEPKESEMPTESSTKEEPRMPIESSSNKAEPDDSSEIVTAPGEWTDVGEGFVELKQDDSGRHSIYELPANIDFKGEDYKLYALMENGEDGRIKWLANGDLPLSPFYSLHVSYVNGLTIVWDFTKDSAWAGDDKTVAIQALKAILKLGDQLFEQEVTNNAYLFVLDGSVEPDTLSFYNEEGELQGGTNDDPGGVSFKEFSEPPHS